MGTGIAPVLRPDNPGRLGTGGQGDFRVPEHFAGVCNCFLPPSIVRIRGQQLPPDFQGPQQTTLIGRLAECDLEAIARVVIEELSSIYGQRFLLNQEGGVRGIWDAEELRRALWNLAVNAVKYGAPDRPITITVKASIPESQISVHNYGSVIAPEDQRDIFDSFT